MLGQAPDDNVIRMADFAWRRPKRPQSRLNVALANLEQPQKEAVLGLLDTFGHLAQGLWEQGLSGAQHDRVSELTLPTPGTPLAEFGDDALITITLEAGYTFGSADTFKSVLPYFLAGAFARPLESWVIDPDLLKAKLETLGFSDWPSTERRAVAHALAVYAQHELDLADHSAGFEDEALVATKAWAEHAVAAAL